MSRTEMHDWRLENVFVRANELILHWSLRFESDFFVVDWEVVVCRALDHPGQDFRLCFAILSIFLLLLDPSLRAAMVAHGLESHDGHCRYSVAPVTTRERNMVMGCLKFSVASVRVWDRQRPLSRHNRKG